MSPARHHHALPDGYQLHWYRIDSILGQGGFGITYLARDTNLDQLVAIKEFLPSDLAVRTQDSHVHPLSGGHTDTYGWGLNRFLTEARTLAKFRHPNIVRVSSVFEANNTAYMVMEYERGESFENLLKFKRISGEETLKSILLALLDGLELVHDAGFIHRDIKPSNIYLREDGVPVLLDFGSARLALGVETRTLTSLVSPGYAPFEQYNATRESDKQGPWTDIYALGATLYRAVTGQGPVDAAARADSLLDEQRDPFEPCAQLAPPGYSPEFLHAIDRALAFSPGERPQSVAGWRRLVFAGAVNSEAATVAAGAPPAPGGGVDLVLEDATAAGDGVTRTVPMAALEQSRDLPPPANVTARRWFIATCLVVIAGVGAAAWLALRSQGPDEPGAADRAASTPRTSASKPALQVSASTRSGNDATAPPALPTPKHAAPAAAGENTADSPTDSAPAPAIATLAADSGSANPAAPAATTASAAAAPSAPTLPEKAPVTTANAAPPPAAPEPAASPPATKTATPAKAPAKAPVKAPAEAPAKTPAEPRTRQEKIAVLLVTAEENLRADRLTKPRRRNALSDYLTVIAMDSSNQPAHRGVEDIVRRYVAWAREATAAGRLDKASDNLRQARFVLDAMKLRDWPGSIYDTLFAEYLDADRHLAAAR